MSTQLSDIQGVTITRYARGEGLGQGYQVTWYNGGFGLIFDYASFDNIKDAKAFQALLLKRLK